MSDFGPLRSLKIVEMAAIGPVPLFGAIFADLGAIVIRVDRQDHAGTVAVNAANRPTIYLNAKSAAGASCVLDLVANADILVEGFRPGVMERLGLGPDTCLATNPRLVYGRCTGWGQDGALASMPGHDINYIALAGVLGAIGPREMPLPPLNLVADYGGGTMLLAVGVLAALFEARRSGRGQVVDAAMTDGAGLLAAAIYEQLNRDRWENQRASNRVDGAAPYYRCYRCADGKWIAVGAMEMKFREALSVVVGLPELAEDSSSNRERWPDLAEQMVKIFATATRDEWTSRMDGVQCCATPVLDLVEAPLHPHNRERRSFTHDGMGWVPAPAPRFSVTPAQRRQARPVDEVLREFGFSAEEFRRRSAG